jgi:hypothetical protein
MPHVAACDRACHFTPTGESPAVGLLLGPVMRIIFPCRASAKPVPLFLHCSRSGGRRWRGALRLRSGHSSAKRGWDLAGTGAACKVVGLCYQERFSARIYVCCLRIWHGRPLQIASRSFLVERSPKRPG